MRKQSDRSLRNRIFIMMTVLVAIQSVSLIFSLFISRVFTELDQEAFRLVENSTTVHAEALDNQTNDIIGNTIYSATKLARQLENLALLYDTIPEDIYKSDSVYEEAAFLSADVVINFLRDNLVSGSFVILNGSNANKESYNDFSSVYIRNTTSSIATDDKENYQIELGPAALSKKYGIKIGLDWDIDIKLDRVNRDHNFYFNPLRANEAFKKSEIERFGYWSFPINILENDRVKAITYTIPLVDSRGNSFGVFGCDISVKHLESHYVSERDVLYENSFFTLAHMTDATTIGLDWFVPSNPVAQVQLEQLDQVPIKAIDEQGFYEAWLPGLGDVYVYVSPLEMYSKNSPFYDEEWTLLSFTPQKVLHDSSRTVRQVLIGSISIITIVAFMAVFVLTYFSTRQISVLPDTIRSFNPYDEISFQKTGLREIDELTSAIEMLSDSVVNASKITSKIMELTSMPMGVYEISEQNDYVVITDYVYYLMNKNIDEMVGRQEWDEFYEKITQVSSVGNENVYKFPTEDENDTLWLRIQQASTDTGFVGTILDVTEDIERTEQLAKELDFDSLTHLYNRVAFKREAYRLVQEEPDKVGAMIFSDLDNLKYINDSFGHEVGDRLLKKAGEMFDQLSQIGGIVSRISGDEFAVYVHGYDTQEELRNDIFSMFHAHENSYIQTPDGGIQRVRYSTGIAWYPMDSDNITDLLKLSDFAMYEAKNSRKGTIFEFDKESYKKNVYLLENREAINQLLDDALIRFDFQPIISLETGEIYGYEALMRSELDTFESPMEILAVATAESKLAQLENLIMLKMYQFVGDNIGRLGEKKIFINSLPDQLLSEEDSQFLQKRYPHIFENIVIEITEEKDLSLQTLKNKISDLRGRASMIAIDDYGSGYSNEVRVLALEPDIIKLDMGIIQGVSKDRDKKQLVENTISFCRQKGILTIAEGVEDIEDLDLLIDMGADYIQGYIVGRPFFDLSDVDQDIVDYIIQKNIEKQEDRKAN